MYICFYKKKKSICYTRVKDCVKVLRKSQNIRTSYLNREFVVILRCKKTKFDYTNTRVERQNSVFDARSKKVESSVYKNHVLTRLYRKNSRFFVHTN